MLRLLGYIAMILAPLLVLFALVIAVGMAFFGLAVLRSDVLALFVMAFIAFALTTSVTVGVWLARAPKPPPRPEEPSS